MKYFIVLILVIFLSCENHKKLYITENDMKVFLEGNILKTEKMLEKYDINAVDSKGNTIILRYLIENRDENKLEYYKNLINKKIDINKPNNINTTLLSYSCENNKPKIIKLLFENNVKAEINDSFGNPVIYQCVLHVKDVSVLDLFFKNKNIDIHKEENKQNSLFKIALLTHNQNVIEYFLQKTDMKTVMSLYFKEITEYINKVSIENAKYFLDKIEDINITDNLNHNLLFFATENFDLELIEYLVEKRNININASNYYNKTILDSVINIKIITNKIDYSEGIDSVKYKELPNTKEKQKIIIIEYLKSKGAKRGCELRNEKSD